MSRNNHHIREHPGKDASIEERRQFWMERRDGRAETRKENLAGMLAGWDAVRSQMDERVRADPDITKPHVLTKMALDVITKFCKRPSDFFKGFHLISRINGLDQTTQRLEHSIDPTALADMKKYLIDHGVDGLETPKKPSEVIIDVPAKAVDATQA